MSEGLFWIALASLGYIYLGYPALVFLLATLRPHPVQKATIPVSSSIVIAAWNEAEKIGAKLKSVLQSEASGSIVEVIVASDGSTDATIHIARSLGDSRIRIMEFAERRGKAAVLNDVIPQCRGDVVILTDARQEIHPAAVGALLANFADERVGVVSGELVFRTADADTATAGGIDAYWRYEKFIRRHEGLFASVPGATGALYAIRRSLFNPVSPDSLLDDVAIPMQIVSQGYRCVFESSALVFDEPSQQPEHESVRKRRTIAGNAQLVVLYPQWLLPWRNPILFQYVSHKLLRLLSPFCLVVLLVSNAVLANRALYGLFLLLQCLFYGLAVCGRISAAPKWFLTSVPAMFVGLNVTTLQALRDVATGRLCVTWSRGR